MLSDKHRLGTITFLASESVFFIILILTFVFYRNSPANAGGPTPFNSLDVGRTSIFTICLWSSSFTMWMATRHHKRRHTWRWRGWLLLTLGLGASFLYGEVTEYLSAVRDQRVVPNSDVFTGSYYALTGFHGFHVFIGLCLLSIMFILAMRGTFNGGARRGAVASISLYWHFVDIVWVVIFPTVYLWSLAGH